MEPAMLQQQQQQKNKDYEQKVNEMQKLLPCLQQRLANATTQEDNNEELQKLKLLQQVLSGQEYAGDSLTLEELDNYAVMLNDVTNNLHPKPALDAHDTCVENKTTNISPVKNTIAVGIVNQDALETVTNLNSSTNLKEHNEQKSVEEKPLLQENFEKLNEAPIKENESFNNENESLVKESENIKNETKKNEQVLQASLNAQDNQNCVDGTDKFELIDKNLKTATITNESTESTSSSEISHDRLNLENSSRNIDNDQQTNEEVSHITKQPLSNFEAPEDIEEIEYEEVELIKIPESTAEDEMILPDSADEAEYATHKSDDEEEGEEEEEQLDNDDEVEEENIEGAETNGNVVEKGGEKCNVEAEDSVDGGIDECVNRKTQEDEEEETQDNDSNQKDSISTKQSNEIDNEATCDDETNLEEPLLEVKSNKKTTDNEDICILPTEIAVDMDNQSETPTELEETQSDDPLGQPEVVNEPIIEADSSQQCSEETATTNEDQTTVIESERLVNDVTPKPVPNDNAADDDDVEIIESRNSPICLDTDEEEEKEVVNKTLTSTPKVNAIPSRTKTSKNAVKQHVQAKTPRMQSAIAIKAMKTVTETIELLDSSDEDNVGSSNNLKIKRRNKRNNIPPSVTRTLVKMPISSVHVGKKRTLLPTAQSQKPLKISQVLSGGAIPAACRAFIAETPSHSATTVTTPRNVLLYPPTNFKPTPQSNFLNAVNLLPTLVTSGDNPLAFSATLSNKNIIIPNAFYANRRTTAKEDKLPDATSTTATTATTTTSTKKEKEQSVAETATSTLAAASAGAASSSKNAKMPYMTVTQEQERIYREWLDEFIQNFANPQQIASHSCLVLLQRALKYKVFVRIKDLRTSLNTKAYTSDGTKDAQLLRELYNTLYTSDFRLSIEGLRFCVGACTQIGSNVTLMTDARTGRITTRTSTYDELWTRFGTANGGGTTSDDKRKRQKGDEEYTPAKYYEKKVVKSNVGQGERRKSLRQHRTRCYDETFLYEPEEVDDEQTPTVENAAVTDKRRQDAQMMALVQRKAEEKRLEAKRQRQRQVKSFESAYLEMFASSLKASSASKTNNESALKSRSSNSNDSANTNQIVIDDDDEDDLLNDEPRSHRIYKVVPTRLLAAPKRTHSDENIAEDNIPKAKRGRPRKQELDNSKTQPKGTEPELITCDSTSGDSLSDDDDAFATDDNLPKNVNINWHSGSGDWCEICQKRIPRTVSHYVNEHPKCEVYTSRIPRPILSRLRKQGGQVFRMRPYLNGQEQYEADCVFCQKSCCFKITYWYQHYSMHTGEYAFRCSGCNVRKTTRSAMTSHINQPCRKRGKLLEDYTYNARPKQIEMHICRLCNYMQLNRRNVLKHLRTQHAIKPLLAKHVESIVLLRMPEAEVKQMSAPEVINELMDLTSGGEENSEQMAMTFNYDNFDATDQAGLWDDSDPTDDLSYMICGMLDVQMRADDD